MIPNVIHYCWFSDDEMPPIVKKCIDSWHRYCPDYEFRLWDMESIRDIDVPYLHEALECRKWAFAADYVRLWAVEKYGGIYLDSDVELFKSLDSFRDCRAFIGREDNPHIFSFRPWLYLSSHIFGAEPHHPFIKDCMVYYETWHFKITDNPRLPVALRYNWRIAPEVAAIIAVDYGYNPSVVADYFQKCSEGLEIYPTAVFDSRDLSPESVCRHHFLGSWVEVDEIKMIPVRSVPWWRKFIERGNIKSRVRRLLLKLGYVAYKV